MRSLKITRRSSVLVFFQPKALLLSSVSSCWYLLKQLGAMLRSASNKDSSAWISVCSSALVSALLSSFLMRCSTETRAAAGELKMDFCRPMRTSWPLRSALCSPR